MGNSLSIIYTGESISCGRNLRRDAARGEIIVLGRRKPVPGYGFGDAENGLPLQRSGGLAMAGGEQILLLSDEVHITLADIQRLQKLLDADGRLAR